MNIWLILTFILGSLMAFSIGANDAANSLGVSFGTGAISLTSLIILGSFAEFIGAMFLSGNVASTLGTKIISGLEGQSFLEQDIIMFSVCFSTFIFVTLSVVWAMPISGTHAVIGSLLGAGWIIVGTDRLNWGELLHIMSSWVTSPLLAGFVAFIQMIFIAKFSMDTKYLSYGTRILSTQIIIAFCSALLADYIHDIIYPDTVKKDDDHVLSEKDANSLNLYLDIIVFFVALILSRFCYLLIIMSLNVRKYSCKEKMRYFMISIFMPHKTDYLEEITCTVSICGKDESHEQKDEHQDLMYKNYKIIDKLFKKTLMRHQIDFLIVEPQNTDFSNYIRKYNSFSEDFQVDVIDEKADEKHNVEQNAEENMQYIFTHSRTLRKLMSDEIDSIEPNELRQVIQMYTYQQAVITTQVYRILLLLGTFLVSLSHGSNDVGNAISPVIQIFKNEAKEFSVSWVYFAGSIAIAFGLILLGKRTMDTIGSKLIKLDYMKGFAVCYSTGLSVAFGSIQGIPLSTTHCVVGAMAGIYFAGKFKVVKRVYTLPKDPSNEKDVEESKTGDNMISSDATLLFQDYQEPTDTLNINLDTIKNIVFWCLITIPCSFTLSALICWIIKLIFL